MKTIIIVSFICPIPPIQGNHLAISQLISWLKRQKYKVIFVLQISSITQELRLQLEALVDRLIVIEAQTLAAKKSRQQLLLKNIETFLNKGQNKLRKVFPFFKANVRFNWSSKLSPPPRKFLDCWPETIKAVRQLVQQERSLAVMAQYIYMTPCLENLPKNVLTLTHTHDMLSRVAQEIGNKGVDTQGREITPEQERQALLRGDIIIALQEYEARLFRELVPERNTIILSYSPPYIAEQPNSETISGRVFMTGGNNPYNRRGLLLLCERVWPIVLQAYPEAQLVVAGAASDILPVNTPNATALGIIDSLDREYQQACVVVNPVDLGTGLKIKTVEALCYGKALVSTPGGVEGLPGIQEYPCVVAEDWEDFAKKIIDLLQNNNLREHLEQKALAYAHTYFTEEYVYAELKQCLEERGRNF